MIPCATRTDAGDAALEGLGRELEDAKGGDPLAPVTVVAPSGHAALFVRRALGTGSVSGGGRGWANVRCTTLASLLRTLGGPPLAARGLRVAPSAVELEVIRTQAGTAEGWLGPFSSLPSAPSELQRALVELGRCPPATLEAISASARAGR